MGWINDSDEASSLKYRSRILPPFRGVLKGGGVHGRGIQFALCEASKWLFYLRYESGALYRPSSRDFELSFASWEEADATRLQAIWVYWEQDDAVAGVVMEDDLHPDYRPPSVPAP